MKVDWIALGVKLCGIVALFAAAAAFAMLMLASGSRPDAARVRHEDPAHARVVARGVTLVSTDTLRS